MPNQLSVPETVARVQELAAREHGLSYKEKTKLEVTGVVAWVKDPESDGKYQTVGLKPLDGAIHPVLVVKRFDLVNKQTGQPWNRPLDQSSVGMAMAFVGTASLYQGQYYLFGMFPPSRQNGGASTGTGEAATGHNAQAPTSTPPIDPARAHAIDLLFTGAMQCMIPVDIIEGVDASLSVGDRIDMALNIITRERINRFVALFNKEGPNHQDALPDDGERF